MNFQTIEFPTGSDVLKATLRFREGQIQPWLCDGSQRLTTARKLRKDVLLPGHLAEQLRERLPAERDQQPANLDKVASFLACCPVPNSSVGDHRRAWNR